MPITIVWIVAITNAVNFIDGLDGLAVGVSAISAATLLVIALLVAESNIAIVVAALLGACLGFLPYNFNPAKIFMGDTGSLFLGGAVCGMAKGTLSAGNGDSEPIPGAGRNRTNRIHGCSIKRSPPPH